MGPHPRMITRSLEGKASEQRHSRRVRKTCCENGARSNQLGCPHCCVTVARLVRHFVLLHPQRFCHVPNRGPPHRGVDAGSGHAWHVCRLPRCGCGDEHWLEQGGVGVHRRVKGVGGGDAARERPRFSLDVEQRQQRRGRARCHVGRDGGARRHDWMLSLVREH